MAQRNDSGPFQVRDPALAQDTLCITVASADVASSSLPALLGFMIMRFGPAAIFAFRFGVDLAHLLLICIVSY